ncbi:hypothetical protein RFI_24179 [Reticulomyxa filosa]|uniref:Uncharacterized protein n=1 Tax=Reticulomyxa filosa TaxID=46433 RepID=X6MIC5_RETFI|nr:hypothetical protein RFI_24179 [Reticulomyxa filosa]|eukprot:ETO13197.1 hypothetical protein RFI_24179 [Reticulomyxa filosa]
MRLSERKHTGIEAADKKINEEINKKAAGTVQPRATTVSEKSETINEFTDAREAEKEALRLQTKQLQIAGNELNIINAVIHCIDKVENQNTGIVFCNTSLDIFANSDNCVLAKKYFEQVQCLYDHVFVT